MTILSIFIILYKPLNENHAEQQKLEKYRKKLRQSEQK